MNSGAPPGRKCERIVLAMRANHKVSDMFAYITTPLVIADMRPSGLKTYACLAMWLRDRPLGVESSALADGRCLSLPQVCKYTRGILTFSGGVSVEICQGWTNSQRGLGTCAGP